MGLRIPRTIVVHQGQDGERSIGQIDVANLALPLVVLGEPGLGKSTFCEDMSESLGLKSYFGD